MSRCVKLLKCVVLPTLVVLIWASSSPAQFRGGFGGGPGFGGPGFGGGAMGKLMLLRSEQVQKELKVTDEQKTKIDALLDAGRERFRGQFADFQNLSREEREKKFAELREQGIKAANEDNAKLESILAGEQVTRLDEISLQVRGVAALAEDNVAKELNLTDEQKQKIRSAFETQRTKSEEMFRGLRDIPEEERQQKFGEMREKGEQLRKETETSVLAVLTSEQKDVFELMKGEKFEVDMRSLFPRGDGRPGGDRNRRPRTEESNQRKEA